MRLYHPLNLLGNTLISFLCDALFFTKTAIGVDRLIALQLHLRCKSILTPFRVVCMILLIWVVSAVCSSVRLYSDLTYNALSPIIFTLLVGNFAVYLRVHLIVLWHLTEIINREGSVRVDDIFSVQSFNLNTFLVDILMLCCYLPYSLVLEMFLTGVTISLVFRLIPPTIVLLNSSQKIRCCITGEF